MEISWIKLKTKTFDDEKIQLIEALPEADSILVIWLKLLILAGKINSNGNIFLANNLPYTPEMLSTIFRRPLQNVTFALKILKEFGMIEVTKDNVICINNWEKHQNIEGLEKVREQNRIRQAKFKEKKQINQAKNTTSVTLDNVIVTQQNKNKNKNKNKEIEVSTHPLAKYISEKLPNVSKLKTQLTDEDCKKLVEEFPKEIIKEILMAMENKVDLLKKYKSVDLTIRGWIKRRQNNNHTEIPKRNIKRFGDSEIMNKLYGESNG